MVEERERGCGGAKIVFRFSLWTSSEEWRGKYNKYSLDLIPMRVNLQLHSGRAAPRRRRMGELSMDFSGVCPRCFSPRQITFHPCGRWRWKEALDGGKHHIAVVKHSLCVLGFSSSLLVTLWARHRKTPSHCEARAYFISNNDRIMCVIHAWWLSKYKKFHFSGDNEKRKMNGGRKRRKNKSLWRVCVGRPESSPTERTEWIFVRFRVGGRKIIKKRKLF